MLLLSGATANHITDYLGQAPVLCLFANEGISEMVSLLLEFGADVDYANNQGCTPLIMASIRGHQEIVEQLVAAGANLGRTDTACRQVLFSQWILLGKRVKLTWQCFFHFRCALVHAARNGHLNILAYLLNCDWVVDSQQREVELGEATQQALIAAASQGHEEIVEYLLDMTAVDIDGQCTLTGETALTIAAANGSHNVCSTLINRGCQISATNRKVCDLLC